MRKRLPDKLPLLPFRISGKGMQEMIAETKIHIGMSYKRAMQR